MNDTQTITWGTFKDTLLLHPELRLQFEYAERQWVDASYHITEVKQAPITSVDCGGVVDNWTEIIVQLYEPDNKDQQFAMKVSKAMGIVAVVERAMHLELDAIVKIEFGNDEFQTRQMVPNRFMIDGKNLVVDLRADTVQCKAIGRGGSCGTNEKPKIALKNLAVAADSCAPGSGCC